MPRRAPSIPVVALLLTGATLPAAAHAGPPKAGLAACVGIEAAEERLACYDRASGRAATAKAASGKPPAKAAPAVTEPVPAALAAANPTPEPAPAARSAPRADSMIRSAWGFEPDSSRYLISLYRPNYALLGRYSDNPNEGPFRVLFDALDYPDGELDSTEAEFQLSFKARLWATDDRQLGIWAGYTQRSQWQVYNSELSRPFRETNYEPELFVSYNPDVSFAGFDWRLLNLGYNHQSNGRSDPISRSWDRIVAEIGIERDNFALLIRPWAIIDKGGDDNPDIDDYMGYGDITALYRWQGHSFTLMGRGNPGTGKGAAQLTWTSPPLLGPLRAYVEAFTGYGDSLIDYNWRQNTIGIGIALNDPLDRPGQWPWSE
jgi:phospholipase A1